MKDLYLVEISSYEGWSRYDDVVAFCETEELATKVAKKCLKELLEKKYSNVHHIEDNIRYNKNSEGYYFAMVYSHLIQVVKRSILTEEAEADDFERCF